MPILIQRGKTLRHAESDLKKIQEFVGLTDTELKRITSRVPEMNEYNATTSKCCIDSIQKRLSLSDMEVKKKIVLRLPQVLGYNFSTDIDPSLTMVQEKLALTDDELKSLVLKCPQLIGLDYTKDVEPKIYVILETLGGGADFATTKLEILKNPSLLELPVRGGVLSRKKRET